MLLWEILPAWQLTKMQALYFQGSQAAVLVGKPDRPETVAALQWWSDAFRKVAGDKPLLAIMNVASRSAAESFDAEPVRRVSDRLRASLAVSSASTPERTQDALRNLAAEIIRNHRATHESASGPRGRRILGRNRNGPTARAKRNAIVAPSATPESLATSGRSHPCENSLASIPLAPHNL